MGLSIEVGILADLLENDEEGAQSFIEEMNKLNPFLVSCGLRAHTEPEQCPVFSADMLGYSGLHYLRRIAPHLNLRGSLPAPGGDDAAHDPILDEYYQLLNAPRPGLFGALIGRKQVRREYDHLIVHSDAEGYYLPQDFPEVLFPPEELEIPGGMIGSSPRLLDETRRLAQAIELPLDMDPEADELWKAAETQGEGDALWQRYGVESFTCLRLYHAARHSIEHSAALVFA